MDKVFEEAKRIVSRPVPKFGYGDIGDVLVRYLRTEISAAAAIESLGYLEEDYLRDPRYSSTNGT